MQETLLNRTWAEVNLDSIAHNVRLFREKTKSGTELMGVVKANAYGHGILGIVPVLMENGVTRLAVAMLDEAIELRKNNVKLPILVLGYTDPHRAKEIIEYNVTQTVYGKELALSLSRAGEELQKEARIHIKIETGMGRVGFKPDSESIEIIREIQAMPHLFIEGIFTHFACADEEDPSYTLMQFKQFMDICNELEKTGIHIPIRHACNSAATLRFPEMHLDMVRIGILMYGMSPSSFCNAMRNGFRPAMTLKTNVILVKGLEADQSVSYGRTFVAKQKSIIATIPVGYADGYSRVLSNQAPVLIHEKRYLVVGNICMDMCMVDVTRPIGSRAMNCDESSMEGRKKSSMNASECAGNEAMSVVAKEETACAGDETAVCSQVKEAVRVGDEVVLFGFQGETLLDIDEIAALQKTINYELTCNIGRRVPRIYYQNNRQTGSKNYLLDG